MALSITEASFGIQVCSVRLIVACERAHLPTLQEKREFGIAIDVAEIMAENNWFYTNQNFLVCGRGRSGFDEESVIVDIDNDNNRAWLLRNKGKSFVHNVDGFPACLYIDRKKIQRCVLGVFEKPKIY